MESHHLRGVQAAIDFAESRLATGPVKAGEMAWYGCMSPFHFERIFRQVLGTGPGAYVRQRRLTEAAKRLVATREPVGKIGMDLGYGSASTFARAFHDAYSVWPVEYRRYGLPIFFLDPIRVPSIEIVTAPKTGAPRLESVPTRRFVGLRRSGTNDHEANVRLIYELIRRTGRVADVGDWTWEFVDHLGEDPEGSGYEMFVGWRVESLSRIPDGLEALEVPAHHSLRVEFTGQLEEFLSADLWGPLWGTVTESLGCRSDMQAWKDEKSTPLNDGTGRRCWDVEVPVC